MLGTNDLDEAFVLSNCWDTWYEGNDKMQLIYPYGPCLEPTGYEFSKYLPRSSSVGDVFVKPDGTVHMIRLAGFLEIA